MDLSFQDYQFLDSQTSLESYITGTITTGYLCKETSFNSELSVPALNYPKLIRCHKIDLVRRPKHLSVPHQRTSSIPFHEETVFSHFNVMDNSRESEDSSIVSIWTPPRFYLLTLFREYVYLITNSCQPVRHEN